MRNACALAATCAAVALVIAPLSRGPAVAGEKAALTAQKWEYKVLQRTIADPNVEAAFNKLGADGWELCTSVGWTVSTAGKPTRFATAGASEDATVKGSFVFKRAMR